MADTIVALAFIGPAVLFLLAAGLVRAAKRRMPAPDAARGVAIPQQSPACAPEHCSVPFCDDEVVVHIPAGFDRWPFCLTHGMPYLRSDQDVAA